MRLLVFSDLHLHTWKSFGIDKNSLLSKRLSDQVSVVSQILEIVEKEKPDVVVNGGDTFHLRGMIPVEVINIANGFYDKLRKIAKVLTVRGNHDSVSDTVYKEIYDAIYHLEETSIGRVTGISNNDVKIKLVDYCEKIDVDKIKGNDVVILHKQPTLVNEHGFKLQGVDWKTLAKNNKLVLFGHYHKPQKLSDNCFILGSTMQLEFGNDKEHGVYIVDTETSEVKFIPLQYPRFITVQNPSEVNDDGNYYKVLNATKKIENSNVISVVTPKFFEERIKADDFDSIIDEWLVLNGKDINDKAVLESIIDKKKLDVCTNIYKGIVSHVAIYNFLSISAIELKIEHGFTLVTGKNEFGGSNGAGKSSVFDAILWCLFGKTTKGLTGDDVIMRGKKDCSVTVWMRAKDNAHDYVIIARSRKDGLSITIPSEDEGEDITVGMKQDRRQEILEKNILGFDIQTFMSACYFSQESLVLFTDLSDADRTNIISHLLGFEIYDELYEKVKGKVDTLSSELMEIAEEVKTAEHEMEINITKIKENDKSSATLSDDLMNEIGEVSNCKKEIERLKSDASYNYDFDKQIASVLGQEDELNDRVTKLLESSDKLKDDVKDLEITKSRIESEVKSLETNNDNLTKAMVALQSSKLGERCDKCGSVIEKENVNLFVDEKTNELVENCGYIAKNNSDVKKLADEIMRIDILIDVNGRDLRKLNSNIKFLKEENKKLNVAKSEQARINVIIKSCEKDIAKCEERIGQINKRLNDTQDVIGTYQTQVRKLSELCQSKEDKRKEISLDIDRLLFWKKGFSNQGIRVVLLDKFCNEFNAIVNDYISMISSGSMSVLISPTKQLKSGDERNKIGINVIFNGVQVKYESLSGGEKKRVDVALCLALNKWISKRYAIENGLLGVIILDELFAFIDALGEETIGTLLYHEGKNKAIYVISHTQELSSYADKRLEITKENGISHMKVVE